jgi:hypothetical protein
VREGERRPRDWLRLREWRRLRSRLRLRLLLRLRAPLPYFSSYFVLLQTCVRTAENVGSEKCSCWEASAHHTDDVTRNPAPSCHDLCSCRTGEVLRMMDVVTCQVEKAGE